MLEADLLIELSQLIVGGEVIGIIAEYSLEFSACVVELCQFHVFERKRISGE